MSDFQFNSISDLETKKKELDEAGYTQFNGLIGKDTVGLLLDLIRSIDAKTSQPDQANVPYLNKGHNVLYNVQNKDARLVQVMLRNPVLRSVLISTLNDQWYKQIPADQPNYILRSILARSGGDQALPLHIDSFIPSSGSFSWSLQASIVLEDQSPENGCTVFVPGSHKADRYADQASMARAVPVSSKPGDVVVWDSRTWHGTTANTTGKTRWALIATFGRWWLKQNYDITRYLPQDIYEKLTSEEKSVLGYCSIPPKNEFDRIDIKAGYGDLRSAVTDFF